MEVKDIPLVGSPDLRNQNAYTTIGRGQRFINCIFDVVKNPITGGGKTYARKRNGFSTYKTPAAGSSGVAISDDGEVTVFGISGSVYYGSGNTSCGSLGTFSVYKGISKGVIGGEKVWLISTATGGFFLPYGAATASGVTFTANRTSGSVTLAAVSSFTGLYVGQLLTGTGIASGARIASMNTGASTLDMTIAATSGAGTSTTVTFERIAKIIDADFPSTLNGPFVEIDGYVFVAQSGSQRIYNSDQNSITAWGASNYLTLNSNSGDACGVSKYKGRLIGFGTTGFEFFYNAGNSTGSPFTRTGDSGGIGCTAPGSNKFIAWGDDIVVFVSDASRVYVIDGGSAKEITTDEISRYLKSSSGSVYCSVINFSGKTYIHILASNAVGFFYDISAGIFTETSFPADFVFSGVDNAASSGIPRAVGTLDGTGKIYQFANVSPVYQDDGVSYTMTIQTARIDFGTGNRKSILWMELDSDIQSSGTATLEISDDDAQNFTTIGTFDMTQDHPRIYRCGSYKGGINIRITHSANTAFRASTLRVCYTAGSI